MYLAPYLLVASGAWLTDILVLLSVTDSAAWLAGILVLLSVTDSVAWLTDSLRLTVIVTDSIAWLTDIPVLLSQSLILLLG